MLEYITEDVEVSSDSDRKESYEENSNEENCDEENFNDIKLGVECE